MTIEQLCWFSLVGMTTASVGKAFSAYMAGDIGTAVTGVMCVIIACLTLYKTRDEALWENIL